MQAIINVELDDKVAPQLHIDERFVVVLQAVRKFFTRSIGEIRAVTYEGPDGQVSAAVAVITFEFFAPKQVVLDVLGQISRQFHQDCVAVLFNDGEGRLVGPDADRWGGFKIEYFKRPAFYELLEQAA